MTLRVAISAQRSFGSAVIDAVAAAGHEIAVVYAPPPSSTGPDRAALAGERARAAVLPSLRASALPPDLDLIVCAHSHDFVSSAALRRTRLGGIGYHPSLLPRHRGRDAVEWTIRMRDPVAGGSVYWLSDGVDAGPLAAQEHVLVRPRESPSDLWRRLFPLGVEMILAVLGHIAAGRIVRVPQDESCATWEPSIGRPPLFRPDLPTIAPAATSLRFNVSEAALRRS